MLNALRYALALGVAALPNALTAEEELVPSNGAALITGHRFFAAILHFCKLLIKIWTF
jgi:hypothetical protein